MNEIRAVPKNPYKRRKPTRRQRNNFSREVRKQIYERDNGLCQECGRQGTEIHHCVFRSSGGRGVFSNGVLLCSDCHRKVHQSRSLADKWRKIMEERYGPNFYKDEWDLEGD